MKIVCIYMAAGNSRRFGSNKLYYNINGKPMYRHLLERLLCVHARHADWQILVVSQYPALLDGLKDEPVQTVFSPDSPKGASYTIRAALAAAPQADAYVFFMADQPYLKERTVEEFLLSMERSGKNIGCICHKGMTGSPVWFGSYYKNELMSLMGDTGDRKILHKHLQEAYLYEISDEQELCDIDEKQEIFYTLIRKNVKNINLTVKCDGSVVVSAAPGVPEAYIDDFVKSKTPFIKKARSRAKQMKNPCMQFQTGDRMPYLGGHLILQVEKADRRLVPVWLAQVQKGCISNFLRNDRGEAVFCRDGHIYLYVSDPDDTAHKQQLYESWQKMQAGVLCGQLSRKYYPRFQSLGVVYPVIKIRKMRSRWGSCIPQKQKITLNSLLLEKPLESIEYVVVHEFSHFIHPNHSRAFYNFVEQILPDWRERRERLKSKI